MKKLFLFFLLLSAFAFKIDDGICNYTGGESCMNSPDCSFCNITFEMNVSYVGTNALFFIKVKNNEPQTLPLILNIRKGPERKIFQSFDLEPFEIKTINEKYEREPEEIEIIIEIRDRDINTVWGYEKIILPGLEAGQNMEILTPLLSVLAFFSILFFGIKYIIKSKNKRPDPIFVQTFLPPTPPPEEEIIIVAKKKKYFYKKD